MSGHLVNNFLPNKVSLFSHWPIIIWHGTWTWRRRTTWGTSTTIIDYFVQIKLLHIFNMIEIWITFTISANEIMAPFRSSLVNSVPIITWRFGWSGGIEIGVTSSSSLVFFVFQGSIRGTSSISSLNPSISALSIWCLVPQ